MTKLNMDHILVGHQDNEVAENLLKENRKPKAQFGNFHRSTLAFLLALAIRFGEVSYLPEKINGQKLIFVPYL